MDDGFDVGSVDQQVRSFLWDKSWMKTPPVATYTHGLNLLSLGLYIWHLY